MNNPNYQELYSCLDKVKCSGGDEYIALCPFHTDKKPSFSFNVEKGVYYCHSCNEGGTAYDFAKYKGVMNPHQYIKDDNPNKTGLNTGYKTQMKQTTNIDLDSKTSDYKINLLKNKDKFPNLVWDIEMIDELGVGMNDKGSWTFSYFDATNTTIGIQHHKPSFWEKNGTIKAMWYPLNKIGKYSQDNDIYICEGQIDTYTLISAQLQAITSSGGCNTIPRDREGHYDLEYLSDWKGTIYIAYDNDKQGKNGGNKLANEILNQHPQLDVRLFEWDESLPKGYDVFDSWNDGTANDFHKAKKSATKIKTNNKIGGFELFSEDDFDSQELKDREMIIDNILPEKSMIVLAGETGSNKSFLAMQMVMSIANGDDEFLGFKINHKNLKILYCDTEIGKDDLNRRYQKIKAKFPNWRNNKNITWFSRKGKALEPYDSIEKAIKRVKPDILVIDCLYNTTNNADISKNHNISKVTDRIEEFKHKYKIVIFCVHHFNKYGQDEGLKTDRMSGGSALQNWAEHILLLAKTNEDNCRLLKQGKARHTRENSCYYKLEFNHPIMNNVGVCEDWKHLLIENDKKTKWSKLLSECNDEQFSTTDFYNVVDIYNPISVTNRTKRNWLRQMKTANVIEDLGQGLWKKKLKIIVSEK